ncbi:hypothetical protein CWE15_02005 [Aliidiomarina taiwanensis]|uniref:Uncharacterized protein n=1 Tax=Aliidiomarina taiwanensis TaxID=946228 RepID=A0A432X9E3_9GAMM|nr:hypothetical protein [Aliidiomarina taiwanensis]RUO43979.1 hypothetical protein CWE15_02005 [Aliidiomarina taiwanensis]
MDVYRLYLAHLNRRILLVCGVLFFFWIENHYVSLIPETTGWLQFLSIRITDFLSFLAWPFFLLAVVQLLLNRFMLYVYDGEVRPEHFSYELTGFFKKYYLNIVLVGLVISLLTQVSHVSELGFSEWAQGSGVSPAEKVLLILVNLLTFANIVAAFEGSSVLAGLTFVLCYFIFAFCSEAIGDRDKRFAPGASRSSKAETQNVWIRQIKPGAKSPAYYVAVVVFSALTFTLFKHTLPLYLAIILIVLPLLFVLVKHAASYVLYGWDQVFNINDHQGEQTIEYPSAASWRHSEAFQQTWAHAQLQPLFRFTFNKEHLWPLPLRIAYVAAVELIIAFIGLTLLGGFLLGFNSPFFELVTGLQLVGMLSQVWASAPLVVKLGVVLFATWRTFTRLKQFAFQFKHSSLNIDIERFGTFPKFLYIVIVEAVLFGVVLALSGTVMFDFNPNFTALVTSFQWAQVVTVIYVNANLLWKSALAAYLGWRCLVRIGRFKFGLFDIIGKFITVDD